mmetsp:Transcript_20182/g.54329  ORF Transcript_20182/g.54329 Transcript_20182/m.54329 type:complete len:266 (+) Transcript_20182:1274-2071(+)
MGRVTLETAAKHELKLAAPRREGPVWRELEAEGAIVHVPPLVAPELWLGGRGAAGPALGPHLERCERKGRPHERGEGDDHLRARRHLPRTRAPSSRHAVPQLRSGPRCSRRHDARDVHGEARAAELDRRGLNREACAVEGGEVARGRHLDLKLWGPIRLGIKARNGCRHPSEAARHLRDDGEGRGCAVPVTAEGDHRAREGHGNGRAPAHRAHLTRRRCAPSAGRDGCHVEWQLGREESRGVRNAREGCEGREGDGAVEATHAAE